MFFQVTYVLYIYFSEKKNKSVSSVKFLLCVMGIIQTKCLISFTVLSPQFLNLSM